MSKWKPQDRPEKAPLFFTWSPQKEAAPITISRGENARFWDDQDNEWLDMVSLVYNANLGHGERRITEAIKSQADSLCLTMPNGLYPAKIELAEALLEIAPKGFSKVFFTLGGAEANENAIKMARLFTGRYKLMSRYRSYHGATLGALSLTGDYRRPPLEPALPGVIHAMDQPHCADPERAGDVAYGRKCADLYGELLKHEGAGTVAAVILEPIPGANGVLIPPKGFWQRVREVTEQDGALLIADEVLTGFGRTGRWLAIEHESVTPDMITVAKGLTGGYGTLGAVLVHDRVAHHFEENNPYCGLTGYAHPLSCAAALAAIKVYREDRLIERAATMESYFLKGLNSLKRLFPEQVAEVRGRGLLAAMEFNCTTEKMTKLGKTLKKKHLLAYVRPDEGTLILSPPLNISSSDLDLAFSVIEEAIREALI